ncbi:MULTISPECIES: host attachment protein [Ensifer]|uniref:baeRF12 domain-containing protein n=1 Tax=Ensifer TaxID=106591 RepID=UPI000DC2EA13|nr:MULTISPECIES: host attachment family protein [Ensifer]MCY1746313.1 host attachment family protein [Ensifer sp. SL37]RAS08308.1 protein required for attachment to host cells [Ensifer adhaerens]
MKPKIPHDCWILACDGGRALVIRNGGNFEHPNLVVKDSIVNLEAPTRMLGSDREGRVYQSVGGSRSKVEQTDLHEQAEERFITSIASKMSALARDENIKNLVLVAPPRVLGQLRRQLDLRARSVVSAELAKDLVKLEVADIERYFVD